MTLMNTKIQRRNRHSTVMDKFPIQPIRTEADYDRATAVLQDLIGHDDLNQEQQDYIEVMIALVAAYEEKRYAKIMGDVSPLDALKQLAEANAMTIGSIGKIIGSASYASMIFNGDREISKENAKKLAERFRVDAGLFI